MKMQTNMKLKVKTTNKIQVNIMTEMKIDMIMNAVMKANAKTSGSMICVVGKLKTLPPSC